MIAINIDKAKTIVHDIRRANRTAEFAPLDAQATIPGKAEKIEAARQAVREKYAAVQSQIDAAPGIPELKLIVEGL